MIFKFLSAITVMCIVVQAKSVTYSAVNPGKSCESLSANVTQSSNQISEWQRHYNEKCDHNSRITIQTNSKPQSSCNPESKKKLTDDQSTLQEQIQLILRDYSASCTGKIRKRDSNTQLNLINIDRRFFEEPIHKRTQVHSSPVEQRSRCNSLIADSQAKTTQVNNIKRRLNDCLSLNEPSSPPSTTNSQVNSPPTSCILLKYIMQNMLSAHEELVSNYNICSSSNKNQ